MRRRIRNRVAIRALSMRFAAIRATPGRRTQDKVDGTDGGGGEATTTIRNLQTGEETTMARDSHDHEHAPDHAHEAHRDQPHRHDHDHSHDHDHADGAKHSHPHEHGHDHEHDHAGGGHHA